MRVSRQVVLTAGTEKAAAYVISRTPDGGYYVAGSAHTIDGEAWAAQLDTYGAIRWELRYRPFEGSPDPIDAAGRNERHSRFYGVATLADKHTLLCGIKNVRKTPTAFLLRLDAVGKTIEDRSWLAQEDGYAGGIACVNWGDGVAIVGGIVRSGRPIGALAKLDGVGTLIWERFGRHYAAADLLGTPDGDLFTISPGDGETQAIYKIGGDGSVVAQHAIPNGEAHFVHPFARLSEVNLAILLPTNHTVFLTYDRELHGPVHSMMVPNVGIKKVFQLEDRSLVAFGSAYHNTATANVARIYNNSTSTNFVIEPPYSSPWIDDAVRGDGPKEFVTVRQLTDGNSVMAWILIGQ